MDCRTVRHHLELLQENGLITPPTGNAYASPYFLSAYLEGNYAIFERIRRSLPRGERPRTLGWALVQAYREELDHLRAIERNNPRLGERGWSRHIRDDAGTDHLGLLRSFEIPEKHRTTGPPVGPGGD